MTKYVRLSLRWYKGNSKILEDIMKIARHFPDRIYIKYTYVTWIKLVVVCKVLVWLELFPPLRKSVSNEVLIHLLILIFVKSM